MFSAGSQTIRRLSEGWFFNLCCTCVCTKKCFSLAIIYIVQSMHSTYKRWGRNVFGHLSKGIDLNFINEIIGGLGGTLYRFTDKSANGIKNREERSREPLLYQEIQAYVLTTSIDKLFISIETLSLKESTLQRTSYWSQCLPAMKFLRFNWEEI